MQSYLILSVGLLFCSACANPKGSYGCEVWGLRYRPVGAHGGGRDVLSSSHMQAHVRYTALRAVSAFVNNAVMLREPARELLPCMHGILNLTTLQVGFS